MDVLWIAVAMAVSVVGGWPVTAGILKLARSSGVRAVDAAEAGVPAAGEGASREPGVPAGETMQETAVPAAGQDAAAGTVAAADPPSGDSGEAPAVAAGVRPGGEVLRGGLLIGFLERGAVALAILAGQPVAIAYVVAIKGLGRYPELKESPGASERFIIGTLASMLWSAAVAVLAKVLLL
ncbi:hypothetical protein JOF48_000116 [Arthrobacter stackebrandtii]|uniref:MAPEG family protein n=1 Tax=Arthrobacter stackebrandtii TaxID=272161 RepID=A0ABS4YR93_9MICC|nr:hypothetical protein [Arthrobacter stackebrandtii]MBP2411317.1 hypothetical protein [Arthrobacter stackebrandtii]PYH00144.1 hypothetical protein CVV67_11940 [Arthrobacter stackebrandtii]